MFRPNLPPPCGVHVDDPVARTGGQDHDIFGLRQMKRRAVERNPSTARRFISDQAVAPP
jgi:hypothetical protein